MKRSLKSTLLILTYLVAVLAPLLLLLIAPRPEGRTFWREISVALGYAGLSLMGLQFIPPARVPFLARTFQLDILYIFHHNASLLSFAFVLAHPLILFIENPNTMQFLNFISAPRPFGAGVVAFLCLVGLIATSVRREALGIRYEQWRLAHDIFAVLVMGLALLHIFGVGYYTSMPVQRILWILLAAVWAGMLLYIRVIRPARVLRTPYRLAEVVAERDHAWTLRLAPEGHAGMDFRPGQVAWLSIYTSPFSLKEHPFSITSSAERRDQLWFTIKELGDFTNRIGQVPVGEKVYVDGPYGRFSPDDYEAPGYVLIAGGVGSAPMISILRTMADRGDERPITFIYGNVQEESVIYAEELPALSERLNLKVVHVLQYPPEGWEGETGLITPEILERHLPREGHTEWIYLTCGPLPMIDLVEKGLQKLGVPLRKIHSERYEMA